MRDYLMSFDNTDNPNKGGTTEVTRLSSLSWTRGVFSLSNYLNMRTTGVEVKRYVQISHPMIVRAHKEKAAIPERLLMTPTQVCCKGAKEIHDRTNTNP